MGFLPGRGLGRDMPFVHRLVREHRLASDVSNRENVWNVGAHLRIDRDKAALVD